MSDIEEGIQVGCQVADTNKAVFAATQTVSGEDRILILTRFASTVSFCTSRGSGGNTPVGISSERLHFDREEHHLGENGVGCFYIT
jgi:hypothetical protein